MTDYTIWLEEHANKLAREAGTLRGLLDIALITMKTSDDEWVRSDYKWIKARLENMEKEE